MKSAIDWGSKPEPYRSIGLAFVQDLKRICGDVKKEVGAFKAPKRNPPNWHPVSKDQLKR
jgi:hypothetical protein